MIGTDGGKRSATYRAWRRSVNDATYEALEDGLSRTMAADYLRLMATMVEQGLPLHSKPEPESTP